MKKIIAACGNDCSVCPRYMPKIDIELTKTAQLWHQIGYRDKVVSNNEIQCFGCTIDNWCRYKIVECTKKHKIENCDQCQNYPCDKINDTFEHTMIFQPNCKLQCSVEEYEIMRKAFFEKKKNLDEVGNHIK